jgi:hypothetical protein
MADQYAPELKDAISRLETLIMAYRANNKQPPTKVLINDDDEDQSWLMWAAQTLGIPYERTTKFRTKIV